MEQEVAPSALNADRLHRVLVSLPAGLIVTDESGFPLFMNRAAADMLPPHGSPSAFPSLLSQALLFDPLKITEQTKKEALIKDIPYHVFITPVYESSKKTGNIIFFQDASMLREAEELKADFLSTASHELRNPLTAVKNALAILFSLNDGEQAEQRERFLNIASRNADRISSLINEYLDIARIETGKAAFEFQELNVNAFVHMVIAEFKERADQKKIKLQAVIQEGLSSALADPLKLEQIFFNLIGNALKFTGEGGSITVSVKQNTAPARKDTPGRRPMLEVVVADTGIGMPEDKWKLVFEKFYRVTKEAEKAPEGFGLGLAIVKKLVEIHGGTIHVEGNEPAGSRFCFTLQAYSGERRDPGLRRIFDREFQKARKNLHALSIFIVAMENIQALAQGESADSALEKIKAAIKTSLHRKTDVVIQRKECNMFVVFCEVEKEGTQAICTRIESTIVQALKLHYGTLPQETRIRVECSTYPHDAGNQRDLFQQALQKAREDTHGKKENTHR